MIGLLSGVPQLVVKGLHGTGLRPMESLVPAGGQTDADAWLARQQGGVRVVTAPW